MAVPLARPATALLIAVALIAGAAAGGAGPWAHAAAGPAATAKKKPNHKKRCRKGLKRIRGKCRQPVRHPVTRFGVQIVAGPTRISDARALGAGRLRISTVLQSIPHGPTAQALNAGFEVLMTATDQGYPTAPPADLGAYQARLGAALDAYPTPLVSIENEPTANQYYTGTPAQYLEQLAAAIPVARARGIPISDGGVVETGAQYATWYDLWTRGLRGEADRYAQLAFPLGRIGPDILGSLPNSSDPGRPILSDRPAQLALLNDTLALIDGYRSLSIDFVNLHWYQSTPAALEATVAYLRRATGKPVISNEIGQFDRAPETLLALLGVSARLHMPWVVWFGSDGGGGAQGLLDPGSVLRPNGVAFRDYLARCDARVNCGLDKQKHRKKKKKKKKTRR